MLSKAFEKIVPTIAKHKTRKGVSSTSSVFSNTLKTNARRNKCSATRHLENKSTRKQMRNLKINTLKTILGTSRIHYNRFANLNKIVYDTLYRKKSPALPNRTNKKGLCSTRRVTSKPLKAKARHNKVSRTTRSEKKPIQKKKKSLKICTLNTILSMSRVYNSLFANLGKIRDACIYEQVAQMDWETCIFAEPMPIEWWVA